MSNKIKRNRKEIDLRGLKLKISDDIFTSSKKGDYVIKLDLNIYGSLGRNSSFIIKKGSIRCTGSIYLR